MNPGSSESSAYPDTDSSPVVGRPTCVALGMIVPATSSWWPAVSARSPRDRVRVDHRAPHGGWAHDYRHQWRISRGEPDGPYALYLADSAGRFHLLCFDLDGPAAAVAADLALLRRWLSDAGLTGIEATSGTGGHRHVWLTLDAPATADLVAELARAAKSQLPTLDVSALLNPRTGCVRPPGAPHRAGGHATVDPTRLDQARRLWAGGQPLDRLEILVDLISAEAPPLPQAPGRDGARAIAVDVDGDPHLSGDRRPLHPDRLRAAQQPLRPAENASDRLWVVLLGCVRARWHLSDVTTELADAPGLEHVRTEVTEVYDDPARPPRRCRRSAAATKRILRRQWARAVAYVAALPATALAGNDPDYVARAAAIAAAVQALIGRADVSPGYWAARPLARRLLDAHVQVHLHAAQPVIDLSCRRLAELAGCSAPTASRLRRQLTADGWLTPTADSDGPKASSWTLPTIPAAAARSAGSPAPSQPSPALSTYLLPTPDTQAVPPPPIAELPGSTDLRDALLASTLRRLTLTAHPLFTSKKAGGLGAGAGRLLHQVVVTQVDPLPTLELAAALHLSTAATLRAADGLAAAQLLQHHPTGWTAPADYRERLDRAAQRLDVHGEPLQRRRRHVDEQLLWRWWCDEAAWMKLPRDVKYRKAPPADGQVPLLPGATAGLAVRGRLGPMPRNDRGRIDWSAARVTIQNRREEDPAIQAAA